MRSKALNLWQIHAGGVATLALLAIAAYVLAVGPTLRARDTAAAQAVEIAACTTRERELERNLKSLRDQVERQGEEAASAQAMLHPLRELNRRLADIGEAAARAGVQINTIQPGTATNHPRFRSVRIRMTGRARFGECVRFLNALHEEVNHVGVVSFELAGGGASAAAEPIAFTIELDWYAAPPEPGARPR